MSSPQLHHRHVGLILPAVLASLLSVNCSGGGTDSASPTAPANQPEIAHFAGTWTGTMTRPTGLGTIEVRWTFTNKEGKLEGPGSLTYNGVTIDAFMGAAFETFTGAPVIAAFRIERTSATALPACGVFFPSGGPRFGNLTQTSTTATSDVVSVRYNHCQGFIAPDSPSGDRQETTQITLNKQ